MYFFLDWSHKKEARYKHLRQVYVSIMVFKVYNDLMKSFLVEIIHIHLDIPFPGALKMFCLLFLVEMPPTCLCLW